MSKDGHLAEASKARDTWGLILSFENYEFLGSERKEHGTADLVGKKECQRCGWCCLRRSCIATPQEVAVIASYLDLSVSELIKAKMVINKDGDSYHPIWANESQLDIVGSLMSYRRTWDRGYCIFFDRKTHDCLIHDVRPKAAKISECWNFDDEADFNPEKVWTKTLLLKLCPELNFSEED